MSEDADFEFADGLSRRAGGVGVSDRELTKAKTRNILDSGIGSIDIGMRIRDAEFYKDVPMHGDDTDPLNAQGGSASLEALKNTLAARAARVSRQRIASGAPSPPPKAPPRCSSGPCDSPPWYSLRALWALVCDLRMDLRHWRDLPCPPTFGARLTYVLSCGNRSTGLVLLLAGLLLLSLALRLARGGRSF